MRKLNMFVTMIMMILFLIHAVLGSFELMDLGGVHFKWISYGLVVAVIIHALIGIYLTIKTLYILHKTHAPYFKDNKLFWLRRISGFLILFALIFHVLIFRTNNGEMTRLREFTVFNLASQILLVLFIAIHVISNVKPTLIAFGVTSLKKFAVDILIVLSVVLFIALIAFIVYFIRWQG